MKRAMVIAAAVLALRFTGCSINKMATKAVADALSSPGGGAVFTGDGDPKLVGDAIPFAIKMYEALLAEQPNHERLMVTTGSLFVMYANAFVQGPAEMLPQENFTERQEALARAKALYLRGAEILYRSLELKFPGFTKALLGESGDMATILRGAQKEDAEALYWAVGGTMSAFAINPLDLSLGRRIPALTSMIDTAYAVDPDFNNGAIDDFYVLFYASLPDAMGGDKSKVEGHFKLAVEKSKGLSAGPYVSYAQAAAIPAQDAEAFRECLETALAIDPDQDPPTRLVNIISQRKARYLLDNMARYFIDYGNDDWEDW